MSARITRLRNALGLAVVALGSACAGTETGNPPFSGEVSANAIATGSAVTLRSEGTVATVQEVWVNLGQLELGGADPCADATGRIAPLGIDDHGGPEAAPLPAIDNGGGYCRFRVDLPDQAFELPAGAPAALSNHAVVLSGVTASGIPFEAAVSPATEVRLSAQAPVAFGADAPRKVLAFDVSTWLENVDFDALEPVAGRIRLHSASDEGTDAGTAENEAAARSIAERLARGIALYPDEDGDGRPDSDIPLAEAAR